MIVLILRLGSSAKLGSITDFMYDISPVLFSGDREEEVERFKKKKKGQDAEDLLCLLLVLLFSAFFHFASVSSLKLQAFLRVTLSTNHLRKKCTMLNSLVNLPISLFFSQLGKCETST